MVALLTQEDYLTGSKHAEEGSIDADVLRFIWKVKYSVTIKVDMFDI
jgi:hypothetical protein